MKGKTKVLIFIIIFIVSLIGLTYGYYNHISVLINIPFVILMIGGFSLFIEGMNPTKNPAILFFRPVAFFNYLFIEDKYHIILKKRAYELSILTIGIVIFFLLIIVVIPNYIKDLQFLINTGLSLILLGATFSILSFNYSVASREEKDGIIIASGKRFLMATIFSVVFYGLVIMITLIGGYSTYPNNFNLINIADYYLRFALNWILSFILVASVINVVLFLTEGFILIINSTIKFKDRFNTFGENKKE